MSGIVRRAAEFFESFLGQPVREAAWNPVIEFMESCRLHPRSVECLRIEQLNATRPLIALTLQQPDYLAERYQRTREMWRGTRPYEAQPSYFSRN